MSPFTPCLFGLFQAARLGQSETEPTAVSQLGYFKARGLRLTEFPSQRREFWDLKPTRLPVAKMRTGAEEAGQKRQLPDPE